jgi:hypothetical protein
LHDFGRNLAGSDPAENAIWHTMILAARHPARGPRWSGSRPQLVCAGRRAGVSGSARNSVRYVWFGTNVLTTRPMGSPAVLAVSYLVPHR